MIKKQKKDIVGQVAKKRQKRAFNVILTRIEDASMKNMVSNTCDSIKEQDENSRKNRKHTESKIVLKKARQ